MEIKDKTKDDLTDAFAGESQANRKYLAFAKQADSEGFPQAAKLFRAAAESETVHAHRHLKFIGGVGDTMANLKGAIDGENYEFKTMYPSFIGDATAEGDEQVATYLKFVAKVEEEHSALYQNTLANLEGLEETAYFVCSYCGHVHSNEAPEKCPICGAPKSQFKEID